MIRVRFALSMLLLWASCAQAFIDPPVITPENASADTSIQVSIRYGVCDAFLSHTIDVVGTSIEIRIRKITTQDDPFCINPIRTAIYTLPLLTAGKHPLTIYLQDNDPPDAQPVLWFQTTLRVAPAGGAAATPVPGLVDRIPIAMLMLGILILAWRRRRSFPAKWFSVSMLSGLTLIGTPQRTDASTTIEILLSADVNAPSVQDIVAWASRDKPDDAPPLPALEAAAFEYVKPLIPEPFRAKGDFKALLQLAPDSPRARLERFVIASFPDTTNAGYVLAALREDRYVLASALMEDYEIDSAELISFGIDGANESLAGQWHLSQLNVPAAWTYNPGHALIAMLDTGLQWDHPNLRALVGNTYSGGNYLPVSSFDIVYLPDPTDHFLDDQVDEMKHVPSTNPACDMGDN